MAIRTNETGWAICSGDVVEGSTQNNCNWSASGPMVAQAALAHEIDFPDHYIRLGTQGGY